MLLAADGNVNLVSSEI